MEFYVSCTRKQEPLQKAYQLENYEVAVFDCYVPTEIMRYSHHNDIKVLVHDKQGSLIETKNFVNSVDLYSVFNAVRTLDSCLQGYATVGIDENGILQCQCKENVKVVFTSSLARIFGLKANIFAGSFVGSYPVTPRLLQDRIILTSNMALTTTANRLGLRSIYQGPAQHHTAHPEYHRLVDCELNNVKIGFCDIIGMELKIPDDAFSVLLHFRKTNS